MKATILILAVLAGALPTSGMQADGVGSGGVVIEGLVQSYCVPVAEVAFQAVNRSADRVHAWVGIERREADGSWVVQQESVGVHWTKKQARQWTLDAGQAADIVWSDAQAQGQRLGPGIYRAVVTYRTADTPDQRGTHAREFALKQCR